MNDKTKFIWHSILIGCVAVAVSVSFCMLLEATVFKPKPPVIKTYFVSYAIDSPTGFGMSSLDINDGINIIAVKKYLEAQPELLNKKIIILNFVEFKKYEEMGTL